MNRTGLLCNDYFLNIDIVGVSHRRNILVVVVLTDTVRGGTIGSTTDLIGILDRISGLCLLTRDCSLGSIQGRQWGM